MAIAKNIFSNWSNIALSIISVFITYPFLTRVLGEEQYGIWLYISSITGYFMLLQLGVPLANVRFVSKYLASNEPDKVNEVLSSNLVFYSVVATVSAIVGVAFSFFLNNAFSMSSSYVKTAQIAMVIASITIAVSFLFSIFEGVLHALQKFVYLNAIKNVLIIIKVILFFYVLTHQEGLVQLSYIVFFITAAQGIGVYVFAKMKLRSMKLSYRNVNFAVMKEISKFSGYVLLLQLASTISFQTSSIVIGSVISVASIVSFSIANNILMYFMQFVIGISQALLPKISAYDARGDLEAITRTYISYSRLTFIVVSPVCLFLMISGGDFIALWMGEKFRVVSGTVLSILTLSYFFLLVQRAVAFPVCMGTSRMRFLSILMLVTSVANVVLSIWWGAIFGLYGVAWGATVPNLATVIGIMWFMKKSFGINLWDYFSKTVLIPCIGSAAFVVVLFVSRKYIIQNSYVNILCVVLISSLVYAIVTKLICFPKGIKASLV